MAEYFVNGKPDVIDLLNKPWCWRGGRNVSEHMLTLFSCLV